MTVRRFTYTTLGEYAVVGSRWMDCIGRWEYHCLPRRFSESSFRFGLIISRLIISRLKPNFKTLAETIANITPAVLERIAAPREN
jgi:hypothetical protein